ncbi:hypothetical protein Tco_0735245 [Tanacetum coccineum]
MGGKWYVEETVVKAPRIKKTTQAAQGKENTYCRYSPRDHAEELEDSNTFGARSTSSDFTAPLSPDHPLTHTSPTFVPFLCRTARMVVHVLPVMSPSLSASIAEVAVMSDSAFRKRFRSCYETLPSSSPPDLPSQKRSRGTSELVKDDKEEEDEEVEESIDFDSESEDVEDEGPTAEDEGPAVGDEGLATGDESPVKRVESLGLGGDEVVPEGQQRATPVMETAVEDGVEILCDEGDRFRYGSVMLDFHTTSSRTPPLPVPSCSLPVLLQHLIVPLLYFNTPLLHLTIHPAVALPAMAEAEGFLTELGAQVEMQGGLIHDHMVRLRELSPSLFERYDRDIGEIFTRLEAVRDEIFSQRYRLRSLEHE